MQIDTNLRLAIKSKVKAHNENCPSWNVRDADKKKAIQSLVKLPPNKQKVKTALAAIKKARAELKKHQSVLHNLGLDEDLNHIYHAEKFTKSGGVMPPEFTKLSYDAILAELAAADDATGADILKRLNIVW